MPVVHIASSDSKKTQKTSHKRRKDQNSEINELKALLPWSQNSSGIDKISVLRLTSAYMRFKSFWQSAYQDASNEKGKQKELVGFDKLFSEALEGFILILSGTGEVIFVSEGIADYVGITQQEVIGQSIYDLTHEDDAETIKDNLKPECLGQYIHFYIRFKTSLVYGKKQLSKFGGTVMLQVSGKLKVAKRGGSKSDPEHLSLVAECRRIESTSSILELSIPQISFTSTTTMDLKILSIDTKMKTITGFDADIEGSVITNFLHPSDNRRSIHCLKTLLITGQSVSPIIRFMTHTGEWVWVQIEGLVRYESDNRTPKYLEATFKVVCASEGCLKIIEQRELYGKSAGNEDSGIHTDTRFNIPNTPTVSDPKGVVDAIEKTDVSSAVRDVLLHSREDALSSFPLNMNRLANWPEVMDAVVQYETSKGLPANYSTPYPLPDEGETSVIFPTSASTSTPSPLTSELSDISSDVSSPPNNSLSSPAGQVTVSEPVQNLSPAAATVSPTVSPTVLSTTLPPTVPPTVPSTVPLTVPHYEPVVGGINSSHKHLGTSSFIDSQLPLFQPMPVMMPNIYYSTPVNTSGFIPPTNIGVPLYTTLPVGNSNMATNGGVPMHDPFVIDGKYEVSSVPHISALPMLNSQHDMYNIVNYM